MNRRLFASAIAVSAIVSIGILDTTPAQAALSEASLTPKEFATDLGFQDLKNLTLIDPSSSSLKEVKNLITGERQAVSQSFLDQYELDASKLFWNGVDPVEVYFINEGAGYRNQLFYSASDETDNVLKSEMIFSDVSSKNSILSNSDGPLALGQGVSLGKFSGPTQLDFSIISDGFNIAKPGANASAKKIQEYNNKIAKSTLGTDAAKNSDGLQHVVAFQYNDWVILGFEDIIGGGDRDYNDVVFAVRGIQEGAPAPEDVPEPSAMLGVLALGIAGFTTLRRQQAITE